MNHGEEITRSLKTAGIPNYVITTTLLLEKREDLRELVKSRVMVSGSNPSGVFIHTASAAHAGQARKLFYLIAKEHFLSGYTIYCLSLVKLLALLKSEDYTEEFAALQGARMVFVLDFYEHGAQEPASAYDMGVVRSWIKERIEESRPVSFLADAELPKCKWWPESLLGLIGDHTIKITL